MIIDYTTAAQYLGKKADRPLAGRGTRLQRTAEDRIVVRYHNTAVVTYYADRPTMLDSAGWRTLTTKERINTYAPVHLYQDHGVWYLADGYPQTWRSLFEDGVTIDASGKPATLVDPSAHEQVKRTVDRQVSKYIKGFIAHLVELRTMPEPGNGDCFGCWFRSTVEADTRTEPMGVDHYLSHFDEQYYVPSLLLNAMQERKFGDMAFVWQMSAKQLSQKVEPWAVRAALRAFFRARKAKLVTEMQARAA